MPKSRLCLLIVELETIQITMDTGVNGTTIGSLSVALDVSYEFTVGPRAELVNFLH